MFEPISDFKKTFVLMFSIKDDKKFLKEIGFSKNDINSLILAFKNFLIEQHEEYLDYVKYGEESIIEKFLNK